MTSTRLAAAIVLLTAGAMRASAAPTAPTTPAQESLAELLPARARAAFILRKSAIAPLRDLVFNDVEMMRELQPYLERTVGLDLTRLEGVAAFTSNPTAPSPGIAILLRIPSATAGMLKLPVAGEGGGTPLYRLDRDVVCARTKFGVVLGSEPEVRAVVAVDRGHEAALPRDAGLGRLLAEGARDVDAVLAVGPGALPPDKTMGVEDGYLVYRRDGSIELSLQGDPAQLHALRGMAQGAVQMGLAALAQRKEQATAGKDPWLGSAAIIAYHEARRLAAELDPKLEGRALKVRYRPPITSALGGPAAMVVVVGALTAIAIPTFTKYLKRAKTTEARTGVNALANEVSTLIESEPKRAAALRPTEWTPKAGCCGQPDNRCAPEATQWQVPTWKALGFSVGEPSYYQYRVRVDGKGPTARIVVEARGDLDCDGTFSSYRMTIPLSGPRTPLETEHEME